MTPWVRALGAAVAAGLCVGCSSMGDDAVYNDTGQVLRIRLAPNGFFRPDVVVLQPGRSATIFRGDKPRGDLVLEVSGCVRVYEPPLPARTYWPQTPGGDSLVQYQVEPDLRLWLLPYRATAIMRSADLAKLQPAGYPAGPSSTTCR